MVLYTCEPAARQRQHRICAQAVERPCGMRYCCCEGKGLKLMNRTETAEKQHVIQGQKIEEGYLKHGPTVKDLRENITQSIEGYMEWQQI